MNNLEQLTENDIVMEIGVLKIIQKAAKDNPEYYKDVLSLFRKRVRNFDNLHFYVLPFFTEDANLWEYCRQRLEKIKVK